MKEKRNALVIDVGAEKGLGASVAARFAREGFHVFVAGRTAKSLDQVVAQIQRSGGTATALVADATKEADVLSLFDKVCATDGTLIFTGASASMRGRAGFAAFNSAKAALRNMAQAMAKELGPKGLHVAHVVVDGGIDGERLRTRRPELVKQIGEERLVDLGGLADAYWFLHRQPQRAWSFELDMRSNIEPW